MSLIRIQITMQYPTSSLEKKLHLMNLQNHNYKIYIGGSTVNILVSQYQCCKVVSEVPFALYHMSHFLNIIASCHYWAA